MKKTILLLIIVVFTSFTQLYAKGIGENIDRELVKCKSTEDSTMAITDCYNIAIRSWDKELNSQYKLLLKEQPKDVKIRFRDAQRAWVKYKDLEVSAMQTFYGQEEGTIWGLVMLQSQLNIIRDKAIDLYRLRNSINLSGEEH
ncbi:lysozyme inhibitor LprI family protein [Edwardsiella tarda]|uniref:lysozyme inhibitor LprI family protein n=1 Tax=Edwardsiella tarda TaxID=636 RepID=UPI00351CAD9A